MKRFRLSALAAMAAAALSGACANAPVNREPPPRPFTGTKWILMTERALSGEAPWLEFGDGAVTGFSGCNRVMGRYLQDTVGAGASGIPTSTLIVVLTLLVAGGYLFYLSNAGFKNAVDKLISKKQA